MSAIDLTKSELEKELIAKDVALVQSTIGRGLSLVKTYTEETKRNNIIDIVRSCLVYVNNPTEWIYQSIRTIPIGEGVSTIHPGGGYMFEVGRRGRALVEDTKNEIIQALLSKISKNSNPVFLTSVAGMLEVTDVTAMEIVRAAEYNKLILPGVYHGDKIIWGDLNLETLCRVTRYILCEHTDSYKETSIYFEDLVRNLASKAIQSK